MHTKYGRIDTSVRVSVCNETKT